MRTGYQDGEDIALRGGIFWSGSSTGGEGISIPK